MRELIELLDTVSNNIKYELKVAVPGKVIKFNKDTYTIDVQPLIKINTNKGFIDCPIIKNVPIIITNTKTFMIYAPLEVDDIVQLLINDQDIDSVLTNKDATIPESARLHSFEDCVAIPGYVTTQTNITDADDNFRIINKAQNSEIVLYKNGDIGLGKNALSGAVLGDKLLTYFETVMGLLKDHVHASNGVVSTTLVTLAKPTDIISTKVKIK